MTRRSHTAWRMLAALVLMVGVAAGSGATAGAANTAAPAAGLAVTEPNGVGDTLAEMDEFATTVMGDPWDMSQSSDLYYFYAPESGLQNPGFANGVYAGLMAKGNGGERITLLTAGAHDHEAMRIGKIGYNFPINADRYHYASFRMYSSNTQCNSGGIQWLADDAYQASGQQAFAVPPNNCTTGPGWHIYTVDLKIRDGGTSGNLAWGGTLRELLLHPFAGAGTVGSTMKLDWFRLTGQDPRTARPFTIRWTGDGSGGSVTLYASPDDKVLTEDDILIQSGLSPSGGSFVFQTGVLPAGRYYIAAKNAGSTAWSSAPLVINAPTDLTITKPSMTSGEDYATTVIGHPWDMWHNTDLNDYAAPGTTCVTNETYANGIYSAVVPYPVCPQNANAADPILLFGGMNPNPPGTPDPTVDTQKYRYLSYRFVESGTNWSMSRFGWWQMNATDNDLTQKPVMSRDILIVDGWHTYKIDLWADDLVDEVYSAGTPGWRDSAPNRLRFDPNELLPYMLPVTIQLDWIKLTAVDEFVRGQPFTIQYDARSDRAVTLSFFYDNDTNPNNGRTSIGSKRVLPRTGSGSGVGSQTEAAQATAQAAAGVPNCTSLRCLYLPGIFRSLPIDDGQFVWNTAAVPAGTYYVCIQSDDDFNSVYRCSEAPVIAR